MKVAVDLRDKKQMEFYARCPFGLERVVADELEAMGIKSVRPLSGGVAFFGTLEQGYRACLWLRAASRVLLVLGRFAAGNADDLYAGARSIAWQKHLNPASTFAVFARGTNSELRNTQFSALKVKDALCDALVDVFGKRPDVDSNRPSVRLELALRGNKATLFLDLSGEPLHRREYRTAGLQVEAPLKENLAAGMLLLSGWGKRDATAHTPQLVFDPLCGSGTLLLEAACITADRAPGLTRSYWGFLGWLGHDQAVWDKLLDEADQRFEDGLETATAAGCLAQVPAKLPGQDQVASTPDSAPDSTSANTSTATPTSAFVGLDHDPRAISLARESAKRLGFANLVHFEVAKLSAASNTLKQVCASDLPNTGMIITNPPYAHRIGEEDELPALYGQLAAVLKAMPPSWTLHVITSDATIDQHLLRSPYATDTLYNGKIEAALRHYRLADNTTHSLELPTSSGKNLQLEVLEAGTEQFVARLRKVVKERRKWAKREGVSCYRIYDADLPDYAVAIDCYSGVQSGVQQTQAVYYALSEYKAPKEIDPAKASRRFSDVLTVLPHVLDTDAGHIVTKTREQTRGGEQYASLANSAAVSTSLVVEEAGHRFLLDLSGHLDTGLFLDHRLTREFVAKLSEGKSFLNLFAYTAAFSVYAASGRATSTTTVDMSNTYLEWAQKNMRLNGFASSEIELFYPRELSRQSEPAQGTREPGKRLEDTQNPQGPSQQPGLSQKTHRFIRADVLEWLHHELKSARRYDLVFVDPPTFSNSKRMGTRNWDIQRDHLELLCSVMALLNPGGAVIFSCNLRSFKLDEQGLQKAGIATQDITSKTIPHDFARNPKIHKCFLLHKA